MKRVLLVLVTMVAALATASGEGLGVGGEVYFQNKSYDNSSNKADVTAIQTELFVRIPLDGDQELNPFVGYFTVAEKDSQNVTSAIGTDYTWSSITVGAVWNKKIAKVDALSFLAGGRLAADFGGGGEKSYSGDQNTMSVSLSAPLTLDYQVSPNFVLRTSATVVSAQFYTYTSKPTVGNKSTQTEFTISSFQSGIPIGFYFVF